MQTTTPPLRPGSVDGKNINPPPSLNPFRPSGSIITHDGNVVGPGERRAMVKDGTLQELFGAGR